MANAPFEHGVRVYYEDTDAGGIVYYANYLKYAERARTEILRSIGMDQSDLLRDRHIAFAVRACNAEYLKPAILDDALVVRTRVADMTGARLAMHQDVCRGDDVLVELDVKLVCVNTETGAPTRLPLELRERLGRPAAAE